MKVLVTAASTSGSTEEIARAIAGELCAQGLEATVRGPDDVETIDAFDAVVIGSAVYTGRWLASAKAFVDRFHNALVARPVWLFSSGPVGDPSRKLVQKMGAEPPVDVAGILATTKAREHRIFPGKLERRNLSFSQRAFLLAFRWMEGDFRDWNAVKAWADSIADALVPAGSSGSVRKAG